MSKHGGLLCFDLLQLGLLSPGATSVFGGDLFARKQGANAYGVFGLTLENDTVEAALVIQNDIENWKREINQLENEANRLYLILETIH